jgi:sirohydrochlorin ferrochelatase
MATLLAVAHGTADPDGLAEVRRLIGLVQAHRPELPVELAWLERASPSLPELLARLTGRVVLVPLLLSTGYHVKTDIASAIAGRSGIAVARQLGPDPRLTEVVYQRLADRGARHVLLLAAGSSDPEAAAQLDVAAAQLQRLVGSGRTVLARVLSRPDDLIGLPAEPDVANYLLAPGRFDDQLRVVARSLRARSVAGPIGAHPLVAELISDRYDEALTRLG